MSSIKSTSKISAPKNANVPKSRGTHRTLLLANLYSDLQGPQQKTNTSLTSLYDDGDGDAITSSEAASHSTPVSVEQSTVKDGESSMKRKSCDDNVDSETHVKRSKLLVKYHLSGHVAERKGEREEMQDKHIINNEYHSSFTLLHESVHQLCLYGVFDGHGGSRASQYAAQHLPIHLRSHFPRGDMDHIQKNIKRCFVESFKKTDDDFLKDASKRKPTWKDGTTALCVLIINDIAYISNLGDSKAVLCRYNNGKHVAVPLSVDHSPSLYDERKRIQKAGGHVSEGRVMGVLEVSRSIGDGQYKNHGVICTPEVKRCQLTDNDRFIILACDGLWKTFTSQESVDLVVQTINECDETTSTKDKYDAACAKLVSRAVTRLSADNVTVVLISLEKNNDAQSDT